MNVHCWSYNVENNKAFTTNSELPCLFNKYSLNIKDYSLFHNSLFMAPKQSGTETVCIHGQYRCPNLSGVLADTQKLLL